jgi:hypothetical protein
MNDTPNRRSRRAAAATAPVAPAVEASAERAAIERDPSIDATAPPAIDGPIVPGVEVADNAAVLPEPTLVADPDKPMPIVTASPILAIEPSAIDVVKADAQADRVESGLEPARDPDGPHAAAAGQPTLTIEGNAVVTGAETASDRLWPNRDGTDLAQRYGFGDGASDRPEYGDGDIEGFIREIAGIRDNDPERFGRLFLEATGEPWQVTPERDRALSLEDIVGGLEHLQLTGDVVGMDIIRTRFFDTPARAFGDSVADRETRPAVPTVTVIEVVGPAQGRRRAGRSFGTQPTRFLAGELDQEEIELLRSDPLLAVGISEVEADVYGKPVAAG